MRKSELLKAIQSEINRHGLDTFPVRVDNGSVVVPGCPACRKTLYTTSNFIDHINNDVLPPLIDQPASGRGVAKPADDDFLTMSIGPTLSEISGGSPVSRT
jgi:hypothetical protein